MKTSKPCFHPESKFLICGILLIHSVSHFMFGPGDLEMNIILWLASQGSQSNEGDWMKNHIHNHIQAISFSLVALSCPTLCNPMNRSTLGLSVHHQLPEFTQTCVHWIGDAIQPSHPVSSPSPPALNLSQHHDLFKWVSSSHQVTKVLEFQLQHKTKTLQKSKLLRNIGQNLWWIQMQKS